MTFLSVSLAFLGKMVQLLSASLSYVLTAKYELENKFSISYKTLPQHVCKFAPKVRFLMWEMNTGLQVEMSPQILADNLPRFISPKFVLLVTSE